MTEPDVFRVIHRNIHRAIDAWLKLVHDMEADRRPTPPPDDSYRLTAEASRRARFAFAYRLAAELRTLIDAAEPGRGGSQIHFVMDLATQLLGFTLAASRDTDHDGPHLSHSTTTFVNSLMASFALGREALPLQHPEAGHG